MSKTKYFTKGNWRQKTQTKREHKNMIVNNATALITDYQKQYETQIADLKVVHENEMNALKRKHKKTLKYIFIGLAVFKVIVSGLFFYFLK